MCSTEVLVVTRIRARFWQFWFTLFPGFSRERPRSRIRRRDTVPVTHTHTTASHSNVPANCIDCSHQHGLQHDLANVMSQGGLRGGGGSTLLQGLKALLEESTVDTSEQSLYDELCDLVERKPKNFASSIKGFGQ